MANTINWPHNFRHHGAPLDQNTLFESLEQVNIQDMNIGIPNNQRFKGQKFTVKNGPNGKPTEYWFIKDYQEPGLPKFVYNQEGPWFGKTEDECFKDPAFEEQVDWDNWDNLWDEIIDPPEVIPDPVLYQPGGECEPIDLTAHNADEEAHEPIRQRIDDLSGDNIKAQCNPIYENITDNDELKKMSINQYADRQPGAKLWTKQEFEDFNNKLIFGNRKYDGTYFVLE